MKFMNVRFLLKNVYLLLIPTPKLDLFGTFSKIGVENPENPENQEISNCCRKRAS